MATTVANERLTQINAAIPANRYRLTMPALSVSPFTEADIDEAMVLTGLCDLDITAGQCRAFAGRAVLHGEAGDQGLVARDARMKLSGLALFAISPGANQHRCLRVEHLICFDLFEPAVIADLLIAEMLRLAAAAGCNRLSLARPMPDTSASAALVRASAATSLLRIF